MPDGARGIEKHARHMRIGIIVKTTITAPDGNVNRGWRLRIGQMQKDKPPLCVRSADVELAKVRVAARESPIEHFRIHLEITS